MTMAHITITGDTWEECVARMHEEITRQAAIGRRALAMEACPSKKQIVLGFDVEPAFRPVVTTDTRGRPIVMHEECMDWEAEE